MQSNQTKDIQEKIANNLFGNLATASLKSEPRHPPIILFASIIALQK